MTNFKVGDELKFGDKAVIIDISFCEGKMLRAISGELAFSPDNPMQEFPTYRTYGHKNEAIDAMIERLASLKDKVESNPTK